MFHIFHVVPPAAWRFAPKFYLDYTIIFIKGNTANIKIEQTNSSNDINIDNENESEEKDQTENQASSSVESDIDSSISTDNTIIQNEIIEIPETEEAIHTNINIGILSFTGIFLLFSIIFTIIFILGLTTLDGLFNIAPLEPMLKIIIRLIIISIINFIILSWVMKKILVKIK